MKRLYYDYIKKASERLHRHDLVKNEEEEGNVVRLGRRRDERILVIDENEFTVSKEIQENANGYIVVKRCRVTPEMYENIIGWIGNIEKSKIKALKNLKWLQIPYVGWNGYDDEKIYTDFKRIKLTNLQGIFSVPIAEYCCGCMLMVTRKALCLNVLPWRKYPRNEGCFKDLESSEVLIVGAGNIGLEIGKKLRGMGIKKLYGIKRDIIRKNQQYEIFDELGDLSKLKEYTSKVDFVINVLPEMPETNNIFNKDIFKIMKSTAYFFNVGRGNAVNERDLRWAVKHREICGAILDVTKKERKLPFSKLDWTAGIILTKHRSSISRDNQRRKDEFIEKQIRRFIRGEELCNQKRK